MNELQQVYEAIQNGACTAMEIKTATGLDYNKINRATAILETREKVIIQISVGHFNTTSKKYL